jgi:RNA polymerase sigma factor (sigma-70 family)
MRLARYKRSPEGNRLLVGEGVPPAYGVAPDRDLALLYAETYARLHGPLRDHAERLLSMDDARDAVGDAMASLWYQWATLAHEKRNDAYVFGILSHCISAKLKENRLLVSLEDAEPELDRHAMHLAPGDTRETTAAEILDAALAAMPARRREVYLLVREQSFTRKQAAGALGLSEGTINTHMYLATEDLRTAFTRAGFRIADPQRLLPSPKGGDTND